MQGISRKMELTLTPPSPEDARDEETRLLEAIREAWDGGDAEPEEMGNGGEETPIRFQYKALQSLHGALVRGEWRVTASLAFDGLAWNVVGVEPGRTAAAHYGCAVDLGSTTVVLDLMDCGSGKLLDEESGYNRQIRFGEDILSRIFCCKDQPERLKEIQEETCATIRELMDRKLYQTPVNEHFPPGKFESVIDASVQRNHPEYWSFRKRHLLPALQNKQHKSNKERER